MNTAPYMFTLGHHALVLGGSGGIGSEIVRAYAAHGVKSITFTYGRNADAANALTKELEAHGVRVFTAQVDMLDEEAFKGFLNTAEEVHGVPIDMMVNTVGISPDTPLHEQTLELHRKVFDVNVHASFLTVRVVAERMREKKHNGSIVVITSTNAFNSYSSFSLPYDTSKAAQAHGVRILAEEYGGNGVRINGIAPGWVQTSMNDSVPREDMKKEEAKIWSGRQADPVEIARVAVFLSGSGASYIYGQNLMVDGGYR